MGLSCWVEHEDLKEVNHKQNNNKKKEHFQIFHFWSEILKTDQMFPVGLVWTLWCGEQVEMPLSLSLA